MKLIFVTHNLNKLTEVKMLLPENINLLSLNDVNYTDEIDETETTIEGNALLKAQTIFNHTQINCFADDSGLLVDALHGSPGVYSARYAGDQKNDEDNIQKLLTELNGIENRKAHFKTVIALMLNNKSYLFEGVINGTILSKKVGTKGFGYDPIFLPDGYTKTFAEMSLIEKSTISHRAKAVKKLIAFLNNCF